MMRVKLGVVGTQQDAARVYSAVVRLCRGECCPFNPVEALLLKEGLQAMSDLLDSKGTPPEQQLQMGPAQAVMDRRVGVLYASSSQF
jgi:hypothetical protein